MSITEQEARDAAKWIADIGNGTDGKSARRLAAWAMNVLTRRNDERAERLLPIDESWLKTRGEVIRDGKDAFGVRLGPSCTAVMDRPSVFHSVLKNDPSTIVHGIVQGQCISIVVKTRGELLDWEQALKGGGA